MSASFRRALRKETGTAGGNVNWCSHSGEQPQQYLVKLNALTHSLRETFAQCTTRPEQGYLPQCCLWSGKLEAT